MHIGTLKEHPEGGYFREVFRSGYRVSSPTGLSRNALTHIYYELPTGGVSRLHRVAHDEVWNLYRGRGLTLYIWDEQRKVLETTRLDAEKEEFCHIVPGGTWQAAVATDGPVLVGCTVAPGFEFEDFELIDPQSRTAEAFLADNPDLGFVIFTGGER